MFGEGTLDERSVRRSIYFTVKRSRLIPLLQLFDAPDAMQGIGAREESTVAPQALALINSPIVREMAAKFAARVNGGNLNQRTTGIECAQDCDKPTHDHGVAVALEMQAVAPALVPPDLRNQPDLAHAAIDLGSVRLARLGEG